MKNLYTFSLLLTLPLFLALPAQDPDRISYSVNKHELSPAVGPEVLPEFEITLLDAGEQLSTGDLRGKYVLIDVWSITCGVCISEIPELEELNRKYSEENFEILSLAVNLKEEVRNFRKERYAMPWKHAVIRAGSKPFNLLQVRGVPTYYLVAPDGKIVATRKDFQEAGGFNSVISQHIRR